MSDVKQIGKKHSSWLFYEQLTDSWHFTDYTGARKANEMGLQVFWGIIHLSKFSQFEKMLQVEKTDKEEVKKIESEIVPVISEPVQENSGAGVE